MSEEAASDRLSSAADRGEFDSQGIFCAALEAFSHPGRTVYLDTPIAAPFPLAPASAAFLVTVADCQSTIWLQQPNDALRAYLRLHCEAQLVSEPFDARFAIITVPSTMPPLHEFNPGDVASPYQSATLLIQLPQIPPSAVAHPPYPSMRGSSPVEALGLPADFWAQWECNQKLFPRGVDVLFVCNTALFAVPRIIDAGDQKGISERQPKLMF